MTLLRELLHVENVPKMIRNIYNCSTGKIETHTMTKKEMIRLNRYLNKYFRNHWQMYNEGGYGDEVTQ